MILFLFPTENAFGQTDSALTSPEAGSAVMGKVEVTGYIKATNFAGYDLEFTHSSSAESGWFTIQTGAENPTDGVFGVWDTSSISDGDYSLRLTVHYKDGTKTEILIENIRVRNYSPIETTSPRENSLKQPTNLPSIQPTFRPPAEIPRAYSKNGIEISNSDLLITGGLSIGVGIIIAALLSYMFFKKDR